MLSVEEGDGGEEIGERHVDDVFTPCGGGLFGQITPFEDNQSRRESVSGSEVTGYVFGN